MADKRAARGTLIRVSKIGGGGVITACPRDMIFVFGYFDIFGSVLLISGIQEMYICNVSCFRDIERERYIIVYGSHGVPTATAMREEEIFEKR